VNLDVVGQVRGYFARPWASGDPDAVVKAFVCECGEPDCDEVEVRATVGEVATTPPLAHGHPAAP
jgi:hypothetical protein